MKWTALFFLLLFLHPAFAAELPQLINYQGALVDETGKPLASGLYTIEFRIYDAEEEGNLIWGPQIFDGVVAFGHASKVQAVDGNFNVLLGTIDTSKRKLSSAFAAAPRYIEITVHDPDAKAEHTLAPRQQILSVPFALNAQTAQSVAARSISEESIKEGAVNAGIMEDGSALTEILDDDGAGSGLDADTLDGKHASDFIGTQGGAITGNLTVTGDYKLAAPRTIKKHIMAAAFQSANPSDTDNVLHNSYGVWSISPMNGANETIELTAPIDLPDGAVIQSVSISYRDDLNPVDIRIRLYLVRWSMGSIGDTSIATIDEWTSGDSFNWKTFTTNTITESEVDSEYYGYSAFIQLSTNQNVTSVSSTFVIRSITITYTLDHAPIR